jgi:nucleoside 2-deoxyribosyltransferase
MSRRIYLAGGMKTNWQQRLHHALLNHTLIDPRLHGLSDERAYTEWDLRAIRSASLVLAYMDTGNPSGYGLSLEVGYAYAVGKEIWYVCEDASPRQQHFGIVRAVADRTFCSLDAAIQALR